LALLLALRLDRYGKIIGPKYKRVRDFWQKAKTTA